MSACAFARGHPIEFVDNAWRYLDGTPLGAEDRPCTKCGLPATAEGHDACLGAIPGATSACCGHGVSEPFVVMEAGHG